MKKSTHSKIKNTAILFELLTRQVAADTMKGVEKSPALSIIREFFKADNILAKELVLYQTLVNERLNSESKANYLINTVLKLRNKLSAKELKETKYKLISEIKKHYDIQEFFKTNLNDYKVYASVYRVFEGVSVAKVSEVVSSRFTIVEHITKKQQVKLLEESDSVVETYAKQDEEIRLLAYKLMIDKFNEKYQNVLSDKQKNILKEYINNVSNTHSLKNFVVGEGRTLQTEIKTLNKKVKDKITNIKLNEVCNMLDRLEKTKTIKDTHVLSLLLYHELIKELKNVKN